MRRRNKLSLTAWVRRMANEATAVGELARRVLCDPRRPWSLKPNTWMQYLEESHGTPPQLEAGRRLLERYQAELERLDRDVRRTLATETMKPREAAALLGISAGQLWRLRAAGYVRAHITANATRYDRGDIETVQQQGVHQLLASMKKPRPATSERPPGQ